MYFDNNGPTGPKCGDGRVHTAPANAEQLDDNQLRPRYSIWLTSAQWVDWWDVHLYRDRMLKRLDVPSFPMVGTVAWRDLADDHPAKLAAAFDAAQHWALRVDTCQQANHQASQAIAAAADWSVIGRRIRERQEFVNAHSWAKRVTR